MATAPRQTSPTVNQFVELCSDFTKDAGVYAASGVYSAETDSNIRQILVAINGLQAAINAIPFSVRNPPQPTPTMPQASR